MDLRWLWAAMLSVMVVIDAVGVVYIVKLIRKRKRLLDKEPQTPKIAAEQREIPSEMELAPPYPLASPQLREQQERAAMRRLVEEERSGNVNPSRPTHAFNRENNVSESVVVVSHSGTADESKYPHPEIPSLTVTPVKNSRLVLNPPDLGSLVVPPPTKTPSPSRQTRRVRVVSPHYAISPSTAPDSTEEGTLDRRDLRDNNIMDHSVPGPVDFHEISGHSEGLNDSWWCSHSQSEEARGVRLFDDKPDSPQRRTHADPCDVIPAYDRERPAVTLRPVRMLSSAAPQSSNNFPTASAASILEPRAASTSADSKQSFPGVLSFFITL